MNGQSFYKFIIDGLHIYETGCLSGFIKSDEIEGYNITTDKNGNILEKRPIYESIAFKADIGCIRDYSKLPDSQIHLFFFVGLKQYKIHTYSAFYNEFNSNYHLFRRIISRVLDIVFPDYEYYACKHGEDFTTNDSNVDLVERVITYNNYCIIGKPKFTDVISVNKKDWDSYEDSYEKELNYKKLVKKFGANPFKTLQENKIDLMLNRLAKACFWERNKTAFFERDYSHYRTIYLGYYDR